MQSLLDFNYSSGRTSNGSQPSLKLKYQYVGIGNAPLGTYGVLDNGVFEPRGTIAELLSLAKDSLVEKELSNIETLSYSDHATKITDNELGAEFGGALNLRYRVDQRETLIAELKHVREVVLLNADKLVVDLKNFLALKQNRAHADLFVANKYVVLVAKVMCDSGFLVRKDASEEKAGGELTVKASVAAGKGGALTANATTFKGKGHASCAITNAPEGMLLGLRGRRAVRYSLFGGLSLSSSPASYSIGAEKLTTEPAKKRVRATEDTSNDDIDFVDVPSAD